MHHPPLDSRLMFEQPPGMSRGIDEQISKTQHRLLHTGTVFQIKEKSYLETKRF